MDKTITPPKIVNADAFFAVKEAVEAWMKRTNRIVEDAHESKHSTKQNSRASQNRKRIHRVLDAR